MKFKLVHPWWVHIPAIVALLVFLGFLFSSLPLPANAPLHFGTDGTPNRYGSPWEACGIIIGLSIIFLVISGIIDELWAKQEKRKAFNWLSLLDDIVIGAMSGFGIGYLLYLQEGQAGQIYSPVHFWTVCGGAVILAIILEFLRPHRPYQEPLASMETEELKAELVQKLKKNQPMVYWDYQNPLYITLLTTVLPLVLMVASIPAWMSVPWSGALVMAVGLILIIPHGGQRTLVTRDNLTVRWGIFGLKALKLDIADIDTAEIHEFSPLRDFGGYGIRFNREMKAYYTGGNTGVKITMLDGKKYLIGSYTPYHLQTVLEEILKNR